MKNTLFLFAAVLAMSAATAMAAPAWVAYNDCVDTTGNAANVTNVIVGQTGALKNFATGASLSAQVQVISNNGNAVTGAGNALGGPGTDAYAEFGGKIGSLDPLWYYDNNGTIDPWSYDVVFTGLDPSKTYAFATTLNRGSYDNRWTKITLSSVDAAANASSAGVFQSGLLASLPSNNTATGYIAKWDAINPGADGSFKATFTYSSLGAGVDRPAGTSQDGLKAYGPGVFSLTQEVPEPSTFVLLAMGLVGFGMYLIRKR